VYQLLRCCQAAELCLEKLSLVERDLATIGIQMNRLQPKHPRAIRWFHWINIPLLMIMVWSGLMIYCSTDDYDLSIGGFVIFHFFPTWFYRDLGLYRMLPFGMAYHFTFMWFFALNGLCYVVYTCISGQWRELFPNRHTLREACQFLLFEFQLRQEPPPQTKYNAVQRLAYTGIILMGVGSIVTGLAIYKPTQLAWLTWLLGGYEWARWEHFALMFSYLFFVVIHVGQVVRSGWNNFRSMVTGYELVPEKEENHAR
jgi:thiosulfate reductase cytochrome b subunit